MILPKIDKEFKNLIQPLSDEEFSGLKMSIEKEGFRDPFIVWGSEKILIDGHNRFKIGKEAKWAEGYEFNIFELEFENRNEAKIWIIKNQFSRRNLTAYQRGELALELEGVWRAKGKENLKTPTGGKNKTTLTCQNSDKSTIDTKKELAKVAGVSHDTIAKVKVIKAEADEEVKDNLREGNTSINKEYQEVRKRKKAKRKS